MRQRTFKINGVNTKATLLCGIPGLVKVYSIEGYDRPWLVMGAQKFTLQDGPNDLVMRFVNLRYKPASEHDRIIFEFKKLCLTYKES